AFAHLKRPRGRNAFLPRVKPHHHFTEAHQIPPASLLRFDFQTHESPLSQSAPAPVSAPKCESEAAQSSKRYPPSQTESCNFPSIAACAPPLQQSACPGCLRPSPRSQPPSPPPAPETCPKSTYTNSPKIPDAPRQPGQSAKPRPTSSRSDMRK